MFKNLNKYWPLPFLLIFLLSFISRYFIIVNTSDPQKNLVFGVSEGQRMKEIITKVGLGKINPDTLTLSGYQRKVIDSIISLKPRDYNLAQKALIGGLPSAFDPDYLIYNVGMGKIDPDSLLLTSLERKIVDSIISRQPTGYNAVQKSLGTERSKTFYAEKVLRKVGMGEVKPENVKLSASQSRVIDSMLLAFPGNYNDVQKKLLTRKAN